MTFNLKPIGIIFLLSSFSYSSQSEETTMSWSGVVPSAVATNQEIKNENIDELLNDGYLVRDEKMEKDLNVKFEKYNQKLIVLKINNI